MKEISFSLLIYNFQIDYQNIQIVKVGGYMKILKINAEIKNLTQVIKFVIDELPEKYYKTKIQFEIELACEEVFVNICNYAYEEKNGVIEIMIVADAKKMTIVFKDSGIPFNPIKEKIPDITLDLKQRKIGGLGIYLTKKIMDSVEYKNSNNFNILTMIKNFN